MAGETYSRADITLIGGMIFAGLVEASTPTECAALEAWNGQMQERPSVKTRLTISTPVQLPALS